METINLNPFLNLIIAILTIYTWVLIISIVLHWLIAFNIVNPHQPFVSKLNYALYRLTEPILSKVRRYMPNLGGIDISPIAVFLLIFLIKGIIYEYFYHY